MRPSPERSGHSTTPPNVTVRLTVQETTRVLGVTVEAVRGRMHRGKYIKENAAKGCVFVRLTPQQLAKAHEHSDARSDAHTPHVHNQAALIEELRDQNALLPRELEARTQEISRQRHRHHAAITEARDHRSPQPASKGADEGLSAEGTGEQGQEKLASTRQRSWPVRFFYGP